MTNKNKIYKEISIIDTIECKNIPKYQCNSCNYKMVCNGSNVSYFIDKYGYFDQKEFNKEMFETLKKFFINAIEIDKLKSVEYWFHRYKMYKIIKGEKKCEKKLLEHLDIKNIVYKEK